MRYQSVKLFIIFILTLFFMFIVLPGLFNGENKASAGQSLMVTVDASQSSSQINPWLWGMSGDVNSELKTVLVPIDLERDRIFPVSQKSSASADNPDEYDFSEVDNRIYTAYQAGLTPLIKISSVPSVLAKGNLPKNPPHDYNQYQKIVANIIRHYAKGWHKGYSYPVKYVSFFNEPDLGNQVFWGGTAEEFYKTYAAAAQGVKSVDKSIAVGGPELAWMEYTRSTPMLKGFLSYCSRNQVPLDIFTYHQYDFIPNAYFDKATILNAALEQYPNLSPLYGKPMMFNTEWNLVVGIIMPQLGSQFSPAEAAAHNVSSIIRMLDGGVSAAYRFPDNPVWPPSAITALNKMRETPTRISATGTNPFGIAVLAGKKNDTSAINILVSQFEASNISRTHYAIPPEMDDFHQQLKSRFTASNNRQTEPKYSNIQLHLKNLPWNNTQTCLIEHYVIDEQHSLTKLDTRKYSGNSVLDYECNTAYPSVHWFKVTLQ